MILVTGAGGFLGPHVVAKLLEAPGGAGVRVLLRRDVDRFVERFPAVDALEGDLFDDEALAAAVSGVDAVVHLASKNVDRDGSGFDVNPEGTARLCRAAIDAGAARFVYMSSVGVYGHGAHRAADETTPVRPDTPFSASKAAAESVLLEHHQQGRLRATVLRHRFVYGEGDVSVLPRLIRAARKIPLWVGGGRARISMIWAADLAEVVRRFALAESAGDPAGDRPQEGNDAAEPVFHVTSGESLTYREVIRTICDAFGYRAPRLSVPKGLLLAPLVVREKLLGLDPETVAGLSSLRVKMIAQDNEFSNEKLLRRFPDLTFTPFGEGLERSLDYYRHFA